MTITRCNTCVMPLGTRPDTAHHDGKCSACANFEARPEIDWAAREEQLRELVAGLPANRDGFTCVVPSSGGKDSTFQVLKLIEYGARPLVVTATTCYLTPIGRRNIDNLARFATTIEISPNKEVRKKLNKIGMEMVGDCSHPEHMAIFSVPFRVARDTGIKTIFYGENPQREYGSPPGAEEALTMTRRWIHEFGGLLGMRAADFVGMDGITEADMQDYMLPSDEDLEGINAYFLGQFLPWDSRRNAEVAIANGMEAKLPCEASWFEAENVDCALTGIHDHQMYLKYKFGRLCAQVSIDVRNGRMTRDEALRLVRERDGVFPDVYAGVPIEDVLKHLGVNREWLDEVLDLHTDHSLFKNDSGRLVVKEGSDDELVCSA